MIIFVAFEFHVQFYFLHSKSNCSAWIKKRQFFENAKATTAKFNYIDFFPLRTVHTTRTTVSHKTKKRKLISNFRHQTLPGFKFQYCILFYINISYIVYVFSIKMIQVFHFSTFVWQSIVSVFFLAINLTNWISQKKKKRYRTTLGSF